ncbi:MAG: bifunctional adenosylcobinamide kinase/adenosylcobinamide-phosphate guanylyltransferase [Aquihabitans sp.]
MSKPSTTSGPLTLVLGGTRSGKSRVAEDLAGRDGLPVTYLATAMVQPDDADHQERIATHRERRPSTWTTVECADPSHLAELTRTIAGPILIDSLGSWVAGHTDLVVDGPALASALRARQHPTIVVAEEVGWSLHAPTVIGRRFVDALGTLNQEVAAVADRVLLVVAGRVLELPAPDGCDTP